MKKIRKSFECLLLAGFLCQGFAVNKSAMVRSFFVPGMGQMGGGGAHTYIGLAIVLAEAGAIHSAVAEMSRASAFQRETVVFSKTYDYATTFDDKTEIRNKWILASSNAKKSKNNMTLWAAVAGGIWAVNVLEAALFVPSKEEESTSRFFGKYEPRLCVAPEDGKMGLEIVGHF